jgi:hypothetical protein
VIAQGRKRLQTVAEVEGTRAQKLQKREKRNMKLL